MSRNGDQAIALAVERKKLRAELERRLQEPPHCFTPRAVKAVFGLLDKLAAAASGAAEPSIDVRVSPKRRSNVTISFVLRHLAPREAEPRPGTTHEELSRYCFPWGDRLLLQTTEGDKVVLIGRPAG